MNRRAPLLLAGPTAVGKSAVALHIAESIGGEIVSVDSMQVYQGMDIGTGKPNAVERARVPHHLIDIAPVHEPFDAAQFRTRAIEVISGIQARERTPILCGGTGFYFKVLLHGLGTAPGPDPALRRELEQTPTTELLNELERLDPATYAKIDRHNHRRLIRAVEVVRLTGKPYAQQRASSGMTGSGGLSVGAEGPSFFALHRSAADLRGRIEARVDTMFALGLVEETRRLLAEGLAANRTACLALGYRQVAEHLQGKRSLDETIALVKQRTWQYARRQRTWLRHQAEAQWIDVGVDEGPEEVAARVQRLWRR